MITALIVDDEQNCINTLLNDLKAFPEVEVLDVCLGGKEALLALKKHEPDVLFLDVAMPGITGLELLEFLGSDLRSQVIFTSAHHQFALNAFKFSAIDYLLKPFDQEDLGAALEKIKRNKRHTDGYDRLRNFLQNNHTDPMHRKLAVPHREGYIFIPVKDILYCRADGAYTHLVLKGKEPILLSKPLGEAEGLLPEDCFERIHHSYIINTTHISQLIRSEGTYVVMDNGDEIPVSKSRKDMFLSKIGLGKRI